METSIIIPCFNESKNIISTISNIKKGLKNYLFEIIIIDDFSTDNTKSVLKKIIKKKKLIKYFINERKGLGGAINLGIKKSTGKYICIFMADQSDDVKDLKKYIDTIKEKDLDAILGSRFIKNSKVIDYPLFKLLLNRLFNYFTKLIFFSDYNDFTNAFKLYKSETLYKIKPLISENFNIFLEIPLKIISRKYKYKIIPISWKNRKVGKSNFQIKELGSKYLFTLIYVLAEKILLKKKNY